MCSSHETDGTYVSEEKIPLGRAKHRMEVNIKMGLTEVKCKRGWNVLSWLWVGAVRAHLNTEVIVQVS
jgi:hypothetical protein